MTTVVRTAPTAPRTATPAFHPSAPPRARDFGVGYGASSGYASGRRYTGREWSQPRFRFA